jgi:DNA excision repair protein ERCC-2
VKPTLRIPVRGLVEYALRSGDLDLTTFGVISTTDAIRAHQKIQKSRPDGYASEVTVTHKVETENLILEISGRIDGVFVYPDRVIIDEIKTTKEELIYIAQTENEMHWGQVKCYAYIYAVQHDLAHIDAQLTYYHLEKDQVQEKRRSFSTTALKDFFEDLVARYCAWAERIVAWLGDRDASITTLKFPFDTYRPGQEQMISEVADTIATQGQLLIQAPTGIGKTSAVILPAMRALATGQATKIFYLTARTTGRTACETVLDLFREKGLRMKSISLTAKDKLCFDNDKLCNGTECEYAHQYYERINSAVHDAFQYDNFTRDTILFLAKKHTVCPFEFSLELSLWMDCIICDYNYVFDPRVNLRRFFDDPTNEFILLIDEAHNLVDRAREMYSAELRKEPFLRLRRSVKSKLKKVFTGLGKVNSWFIKARKRCEYDSNPYAEKEAPEDLCSLLKKYASAAEEWLSTNRPAQFRQELLDLYFDVRRFLRTADRYDDNYASCYTKSGNDMSVKLFCLNPAPHLRDTLQRCQAAVFFSATLSPTHYFVESLGCEPHAATLTLPSPFDQDNLRVLVAGRISTLYRYREWTKSKVAHVVSGLIKHKKGNYLIFFPSYEYMKMVYEVFRRYCPRVTTIVQSAGMTEPEREVFLNSFSRSAEDHLVGFAVLGGAFAESIDLLGERLTGAVIVGVGLPPVGMERELIRNYFDNADEEGFAFAYQYPGMIKVLQAAGRVIRSEHDRGVVVLIDSRYRTPAYRDLLPAEWNVVNVGNPDELAIVLEQFWGLMNAGVHNE